MTLWKRGSMWWTYVWVDGVRYAKSTRTRNQRTASKIDQAYKDELLLAQTHPQRLQPQLTFAELAARFLADASPKPHHVDRLKILLPYFGELPIGQIHRGTAREYRKYRHDKKPSLSETTVNRDLEVLRHLLFWALDEGMLATNPLSRMPMVRERRKARSVMSFDEEARLLREAAPHLLRLVISALDTGMRRGELLAQRWEHVDFNRRLLSVTHSKTAGGEGREIPLTTRLYDLLAAQPDKQGFVFLFKGKTIRKIKTGWAAAIRRAGIRYYRFHDLRHTFNTRLMEAGVMQEVRKALMGHSSGEEVNSIYTHVELPVKREAIRRLEAWVEAEREKQTKEHQGEPHAEPEPIHGGGSDRDDSEGLRAAGRNGRGEAQRSQ
jgi:integrase